MDDKAFHKKGTQLGEAILMNANDFMAKHGIADAASTAWPRLTRTAASNSSPTARRSTVHISTRPTTASTHALSACGRIHAETALLGYGAEQFHD